MRQLSFNRRQLKQSYIVVSELTEDEADKKAGDVLAASADVKRGNPTGSNQYQMKVELPKSADSSQSVRAKTNGVHRDTQRKLDRLAKAGSARVNLRL